MTITLDTTHYGFYLRVIADNVNIQEDIEERIYPKKDDGKFDFSKAPIRDITSDSIDQINTLLCDMVYYRKAEYDSSDLIKLLFKKLPDSVAKELSIYLEKDYN